VTCIVGIETPDGIIMGGDAFAECCNVVLSRAAPKVFRAGAFLVGTCGSARYGDVLRLQRFAAPPSRNAHKHIIEAMTALRQSMRDAGLDLDTSKSSDTGRMLLGCRGSLYCIGSDFAAVRDRRGYAAIGSGEEFALGVLYATRGMFPWKRVRLALAAAAEHCSSVRPPWTILEAKA